MRPDLIPGTITQVIGASGQGLTRWARSLGHPVVSQDALAHVTHLRATVAEEIAFGLEQRGIPHAQMHERVTRMLGLIDLAPDMRPAHLSGGQTRRLAIATVAVLEPEVLILDDPFAGLDPASSERLRTLCLSLPGTAIVILGHSPQPLPGDVFSLIDAHLTPHFPPAPIELPAPVGPGASRSLGEVTGQRGGKRRFWQLRSAEKFRIGPVDVTVRDGGVLWLRGANGSGKTTLLRALAGLDGAPARDVSLMVQRAADQVVDSTLAEFIGPRHRELDVDPQTHPLDLGATDLRLAQFLAVAALGRPVLALDEPDVGLDHRGRARMHELIAHELRAGTALVITCHDESFMAEVGEYATVASLSIDA
ncbi:MAG: ATP-binding cassette domain-containing protein [Corynebacterium sp.]|uniref:ATP-binding cassette domain-containing protein n=1 Tax=Corynebacterium sp. TaxID=1720 RepID=UPI0026DF47A8|nr:ATP-binding cassette domain-containing protein [Corynebacterium sp.]MDO5670647.1 ATP-binding cassette domain-containing protein [Corynebacterium sp.]